MKNTVLIVEDSRAFAMSVERAILDGSDFNVVVALDYAQACKLLEQHRDSIFVAVTDLNLPDAKDGAAAKLMNDNDIPCIAFTGNFSASLREKVFKLGVSDYMLKNTKQDIEDVVKVIQRLSDNRDIKVLVVDDALSSRNLIKALLDKQNFQVVAVESGRCALDLLERGERFKILLVDIFMEGMDGFQLLRELRANYDVTQMSIIGISGKSNSSDIAKFMKYGGTTF